MQKKLIIFTLIGVIILLVSGFLFAGNTGGILRANTPEKLTPTPTPTYQYGSNPSPLNLSATPPSAWEIMSQPRVIGSGSPLSYTPAPTGMSDPQKVAEYYSSGTIVSPGLKATSIPPPLSLPAVPPSAWEILSQPHIRGTAVVEIGSAQLAPDTTVKVPVSVNQITAPMGVGAYDLKITFDPKVIQINVVEAGDGAFALPKSVNIDNTKGIVLLNSYQPNIPGPTNDLVIAYLNIKPVGKSGQSTSLDISVTTLSDSLGNDITTKTTGGIVVIQ